MPPIVIDRMYCPRCDRPYLGTGKQGESALDKVKEHVREQHPDHDPEWYETYPEAFGN